MSQEQPTTAADQSIVPGERIIDKPELPPQGYGNTIVAEIETLEGKGQLKVGRSGGFEVFSDEPARLGGDGEYPQPLSYFALGVGF
jgi:hypothetical protein